MSDHYIGQLEFVLQILKQVDDLCLDRDIERRNWFVGDYDLGLERKRAGDADALALAAGELVRVPVVVLRVEANHLQQVLNGPLGAKLGFDVLQPIGGADNRANSVPRIEG